MVRAGRGSGKLAWKGVKLEVWAFAMLMLQLLSFLSFLMVVEEILPPVSLSQNPKVWAWGWRSLGSGKSCRKREPQNHPPGPPRQVLPRQGLQAGASPALGLPGWGLSGRSGRDLPGRGSRVPEGGCDVLPEGLGYLTGFSPATCRVHRAARSCLRDCSSVARRRASGSGAASPAGFGAFALLDGPGLTQFRV